MNKFQRNLIQAKALEQFAKEEYGSRSEERKAAYDARIQAENELVEWGLSVIAKKEPALAAEMKAEFSNPRNSFHKSRFAELTMKF